jgi:hypothetical protein
MKKTIAGVIVVAALAIPAAAFADNGQIVALYQQLIQILEQELGILQNQALSISPSQGSAPLVATFTVNKSTGTEAIDFGDGHSTGSSGCTTNMQGFCDLSRPITHTYQFPGKYKVTLYRGGGESAIAVASQIVTVR